MTKKNLSILGTHGDFSTMFTNEDYATAKEQFDKRIALGYFAFSTKDGENKLIKEFDPTADEITLVRRMVGG